MTRFARIRSAFSIFDSINREYITIVLWIMLFAGLFLYMSVFGDVSLHDFWVNAFTETIGIGVTVLFIDKLLKDRERRRLRPLEIAAFNDVMHFVNGMATSWMNVYSWSGKDELLPPPEPPSMKEFLTPIYFNSIRQRLNLDAHAHVFPKRT